MITESKNTGLYQKEDEVRVELDSFTLQVVLAWIFEASIGKNTWINYAAFVCGNNGYLLSEDYLTIELNKIPRNKINFVFTQIVDALKRLSKFNFFCPKIPFEVTKDFQVKFISNDSSITYNGRRLYHDTHTPTNSNNYLESRDYFNTSGERIKLYRITSLLDLHSELSKKTEGIEGLSSINLYIILFQLMEYPNFREFLSPILFGLFLPSERSRIELTNTWLRSDASNIFEKLIQNK